MKKNIYIYIGIHRTRDEEYSLSVCTVRVRGFSRSRAYCSSAAGRASATIESDVLLGIMERVAYTLMKGLHL